MTLQMFMTNYRGTVLRPTQTGASLPAFAVVFVLAFVWVPACSGMAAGADVSGLFPTLVFSLFNSDLPWQGV